MIVNFICYVIINFFIFFCLGFCNIVWLIVLIVNEGKWEFGYENENLVRRIFINIREFFYLKGRF